MDTRLIPGASEACVLAGARPGHYEGICFPDYTGDPGLETRYLCPRLLHQLSDQILCWCDGMCGSVRRRHLTASRLASRLTDFSDWPWGKKSSCLCFQNIYTKPRNRAKAFYHQTAAQYCGFLRFNISMLLISLTAVLVV